MGPCVNNRNQLPSRPSGLVCPQESTPIVLVQSLGALIRRCLLCAAECSCCGHDHIHRDIIPADDACFPW